MTKSNVEVKDSRYLFNDGLDTAIGHIPYELLDLIFPKASRLQQTCIGLHLCLPNRVVRLETVRKTEIIIHPDPLMLMRSMISSYTKTTYFKKRFVQLCLGSNFVLVLDPEKFFNDISKPARNEFLRNLCALFEADELVLGLESGGDKETVIFFLERVCRKIMNKNDKEILENALLIIRSVDESLL
jgi:hypothetical protein